MIDDITDRKRASEALEAAKLVAEQANLGNSRFLAAASHDLRQPLQRLSLLRGILGKRIKDQSGSRLVAKLEETLSAMSGMLNTLLDINQLEAGVLRPDIVEVQIGTFLDRLRNEVALPRYREATPLAPGPQQPETWQRSPSARAEAPQSS